MKIFLSFPLLPWLEFASVPLDQNAKWTREEKKGKEEEEEQNNRALTVQSSTVHSGQILTVCGGNRQLELENRKKGKRRRFKLA